MKLVATQDYLHKDQVEEHVTFVVCLVTTHIIFETTVV